MPKANRTSKTGAPVYAFTATGLIWKKQPDRDEWEDVGTAIRNLIDGGLWVLGDWLIEGGRRHETNQWFKAAGVYAEATRITGYDQQTLAKAFRVCSTFLPSKRVAELTFSHHWEALLIPNEKRRLDALALARDQEWSVTQFREYIETNKIPTTARRGSLMGERCVQCPNCARTFPVRGNLVKSALRLVDDRPKAEAGTR